MKFPDIRRLWRRRTEQRAITGLPWDIGGPLTSRQVSPDQALSLVPVFGAVRLLASQIASLPLQTYRKVGDGRLRLSTPSLFAQPAASGTLYTWLHRCVTSLALRGNAYGLVTARDSYGYPTMVEWLHPDHVTCQDTALSGPGSYVQPIWYWLGRIVPTEDMIHIAWFTIPGKVLGLSPIEACAATISTGVSAQVYTADWFNNGAVPPGKFRNTQKTISQPESDEIKARLAAAIRSRKPLVYGADWEYDPIAVSANEARFIETMQLNATQIASIYGIPPEMIGGQAGGALTYNTVEQNAINMVKFTLRPWLELLEETFSLLLPRSQYVKFNLDALLRGDLTARTQSYQTWRNIGMANVDELRALEDLGPLPNGEGKDYTPLLVQVAASRGIDAAQVKSGDQPADQPLAGRSLEDDAGPKGWPSFEGYGELEAPVARRSMTGVEAAVALLARRVDPWDPAAMRKFNPAEPRVPGGPHGGEWGSGGGAAKKLGRMTMDEFFAAHGGDDAWHDQYGGGDKPSAILWKNGQASLYYPTGKGQSHAFVLSGMDSHTARQFADAVDWAAKHPLDKPEHLPNGPADETRTVKLPDTEVHIGYGWDPGEESGSYLYVSATFPRGAAAGRDKTFTVDEAVEGSASSFADDLRALADDIDSKAYAKPIPGARAAVALFARRHDPLDPNCTMLPPVDEPDPVDALLAALDEFEAWLSDGARSWDPVKHPRNPKGSPGGGRFRSMVDRLTDALKEHHKGGGKGDPFEGFNREQLRRVAKARGHDLPRGISRDDLAKLLLADLHKGERTAVAPGLGKPRSTRVPGRDRLDEVVRDLHGQPAAYEGRRRKAYDTPYDAHLQKIVKTQGFDAKPQVVTKEHLDQAVKDGWTEVWRGVMGIPGAKRPADINRDLRFGEFEPGRGIYGNGVYTSVRRVSAEVYRGREPVRAAAPGRDFGLDDLDGEAYPDSLLRMAIDPQAKVVNYDDVKPQLQEWRQGVASDSPEALTLSDAGRFAAAKGYDVMLVRGHSDGAFYPGWENSTDDDFTGGIGHPDQYVILNRSVVMIQRAEDVP